MRDELSEVIQKKKKEKLSKSVRREVSDWVESDLCQLNCKMNQSWVSWKTWVEHNPTSDINVINFVPSSLAASTQQMVPEFILHRTTWRCAYNLAP